MSSFSILVPINFSESSKHALSVATSVAHERDGALFIVYVDIPSDVHRSGLNRPISPAELSPYHDKLKQLTPPIPGISYEHRLLRGDTVDTIVHFADQYGIDLIVMSTRSRKGIFRWFKRSVAEAVIRSANCSVLVVK